MKVIESLQNPFIKNIVKLQEKSRERKKQGLLVIEGLREIQMALRGGYALTSLLFVDETKPALLEVAAEVEWIKISQEVYNRLAYRESTEGILAIASCKSHDLADVSLSENSLLLIAESIEKPGNIGAMMRTADAARIEAVILADPRSDLYNPNLIRSSLGCVFTNQVVVADSGEIIQFLKQKDINIYSATLQNSNDYTQVDYTRPTAIVVGSEATGLSEIWRMQATQNINIPMEGNIDSMNVSVSAAILIFEAKRQRRETK